MTYTSREIHLAKRPTGEPTAETFAHVEAVVPEPGDGEVTVRNSYLSVDPYMRGRMNDAKSYLPPFAVGEVMQGGAVGEVVASRSASLAVGDPVLHMNGWREYSTAPAAEFRRIDTALAPAQAYLGILGITGLTAWIGLVDIAGIRDGDVVFVSGAAGAVGSVAGQMARLLGASRVIGSCGSEEKVRHVVDDLGFDCAFNYRTAPVRRQLRAAAPGGIDLYFDNVAGDHLEAAIGVMRTFGRVALCGAVSQYNATAAQPGPANLEVTAIGRRITLRGFIVTDHMARFADFIAQVGPWLSDGRLQARETVVDGIDSAPDAFLGLLRGENTGKMLVRLSD